MADRFITGELPSYFECFWETYESLQKYIDGSNRTYNYPWDFFSEVQQYGSISSQDIWLTLCMGVVWTLARSGLTVLLFQPLAAAMTLMKPPNREKFPESSFKFLYYTCTWSFCVYLLIFSERYTLFHNPYNVWADWRPLMPVDGDIYALYVVQCSFYLHSIYATLFMDVWRKDSIVMLFHHLLTLALIGFSYGIRYHKIGLLVLFVHDVTDVALEFTKLNVYMKDCGGRIRYMVHDALATLGFISFASTWFVFRLYWFPLKVLHASAHGGISLTSPHPPLWLFFNVMLWVLQALNVYWFMFIVLLLYKIATGQLQEIADVREDVDENGKRVDKDSNGHPNTTPAPPGTTRHHLSNTHQNGYTVAKENGTNGIICNGSGDHDVTNHVTSQSNGALHMRGRQRMTRPIGEDE